MWLLDGFWFECSGNHRDLHSFPTRRSSDLRGVPGDRFKTAVRASAQGAGQAVPMILVVVESSGFFAGVTPGTGVSLVAFEPFQVTVFELNLQSAIDAAEDACGGLPLGGTCHRRTPR